MSLRFVDADSGQPIRGTVVVDKHIVKRGMTVFSGEVELKRIAILSQPFLDDLVVSSADMIEVGSPGYRDTRFQVDGRTIYMQAPAAVRPTTGVVEAIFYHDDFDRRLGSRSKLDDCETIIVPLVPER